MDDNHNAVLADFGLSHLQVEHGGHSPSGTEGAGSLRWQPREVVFGDARPSTASDVYSFGMTVIELLSGSPPFGYYAHERSIVMDLYTKLRPRDIVPVISLWSKELTDLITSCWAEDPCERPTLVSVINQLERTMQYMSAHAAQRGVSYKWPSSASSKVVCALRKPVC